MEKITIRLEDGRTIERPAGTRAGDILDSPLSGDGLPYVAAMVNNNVASLSYPLAANCRVRFLTMADPHGWRVYRNSLCFLLAMTVRRMFPKAVFAVEHSFGPGLYCSFYAKEGAPERISRSQVALLEKRMRMLVQRNLPIERRKIGYAEAVERFSRNGEADKLNLLRHRNPPHVVIHVCGNFSDVAHGPLAHSTGALSRFKLIPYPPGFILHLPERENPKRLPRFQDQPNLFHIFQEHKEWGRILGVTNVGRLNEIIAAGEMENFVLIAEALHEKKLAFIAERISRLSRRVRMILVAGPSSAGKTTFAKRLAVHLRVNGLRPVTLATDDYFVGPEQTPRDEDGNLDYEHIEAVDIKLLNRQLSSLIAGRKVRTPKFDFKTRRRVFSETELTLEPDQILIIEGIHGLNPRLIPGVPRKAAFKIYVSALTQLNLDYHNRISTTDNRLMRRMVRDVQFRGYSALETLQRWPSVRRGEKRWIFPYQREADATFNSALDYELAVLKPIVEPLLMEVKPTQAEYAEARRLSEFLLNFRPAPAAIVPSQSILREYIGGSIFRY